MNEKTTEHAVFTIERTYAASPQQVFNAWADPAAKAAWFVAPDEYASSGHRLDFKVGGREHLTSKMTDGPIYTYDALYRDIVENRRIVYAYDMYRDEARISVSLATVEIMPADSGTRLIYTEQGAFLDGGDKPEYREQGTRDLLDKLEAALKKATATA